MAGDSPLPPLLLLLVVVGANESIWSLCLVAVSLSAAATSPVVRWDDLKDDDDCCLEVVEEETEVPPTRRRSGCSGGMVPRLYYFIGVICGGGAVQRRELGGGAVLSTVWSLCFGSRLTGASCVEVDHQSQVEVQVVFHHEKD